MNELIIFFNQHGLIITIIALVGIIILGTLKYCNCFKKIEEKTRHCIYLATSVGFSILATIIYLITINQVDIKYISVVAGAIYALNQTFYNIFKTTSIRAIGTKILDLIKKIFIKFFSGKKIEDAVKETIENK